MSLTLPTAFLGADLELDGTSRRREVSLYLNNQVVLTVENGVTLGLLKLIYSSDRKFSGLLQGIKTRPNPRSGDDAVPTVILSDDRVLDHEEYELIVQELVRANPQQVHHSIPIAASAAIPLPPPPDALPSHAGEHGEGRKIGQYVCEFCHLPFVSKAKFNRHRRIHTEENPYVCVYCEETFSHHQDLRKHRDEQHMGNKTFKCSYCIKTFSTQAELRGHLWRHTGEKNHKCRICCKTFATKGNLKLHIDKHIGLQKHKCPFCPQRFTSHSSLEAHMAKHTGMRAYKCRYCPKSYAQAGQLTSHERIHTGERPFVCQVCGKGFRLNSTRLSHEKRHTSTRPHICETCGRSFAMPEHLRRHLKTHESKLDRLVSCPFCRKKIFAGRNMRKHLVRHRELSLTETQAKAIACTLKPNREENEKDAVDEDMRSMNSSKNLKQPINCLECDVELKSFRKLVEHLSEVHYHRELTGAEKKEVRLRHGLLKIHHCQLCPVDFIDFRLLRSHMLADHPDQAEACGFHSKMGRRHGLSYKCPNCSQYFSMRSTLDEHIIRDHLTMSLEVSPASSEPLQFKCWYCSLFFRSPEDVVSHMTAQHDSLENLSKRVEAEAPIAENSVSSSGLWSCPHCPVSLASEEDYKAHVAGHLEHAQHNSSTYSRPPHNASKSPDVLDGNSVDSLADKFLTVGKSPIPSENPIVGLGEFDLGEKSFSVKGVIDEDDEDALAIDLNVESASTLTLPSESNSDIVNSNLLVARQETCEAKSDSSVANDISLQCHGEFSESPADPASSVEPLTHKMFVVSEDEVESAPSTSVASRSIGESSHECDVAAVRAIAKGKKKKIKFKKGKGRRKDQFKASSSYPWSANYKAAPESCQFCSDVFRDRSELDVHLRVSHTKEYAQVGMPFRCWFCSMAFGTPEDVVTHMTTEHDNLDNLSRRVEVTEIKGASFENTSSKLKPHKHSGDACLSPVNSFQCQQCPKTLGSKEAHELHTMLHEASKNSNLYADSMKHADGLANTRNSEPFDGRSLVPVKFPLSSDAVYIHARPTSDAYEHLSCMTSSCNDSGHPCQQISVEISVPVASDLSPPHVDASSVISAVISGASSELGYPAGPVVTTLQSSLSVSGSRVANPQVSSSLFPCTESPLAVGLDSKALSKAATTVHSSSLSRDESCAYSDGACVDSNLNQAPHEQVPLSSAEIIACSEILQTGHGYDGTVSAYSSKAPGNASTWSDTPRLPKTKSMMPTIIKQMPPSKGGATYVVDGNFNLAVNMCPYCSRVFCSKKALDVHILKIHGRDYLQQSPLKLINTAPFSCWFCSSTFSTPELVVEHMTTVHENLDNLSKRIEEQEPRMAVTSFEAQSAVRRSLGETAARARRLGSSKSNLVLPPISSAASRLVEPVAKQPPPYREGSHKAPPGYKVSYALAYVPVYVPEKADADVYPQESSDPGGHEDRSSVQ